MKINKYITLLLVFVLAITACTKELDRTPSGMISREDVLDDYELTRGLLAVSYNYFFQQIDHIFFFQSLAAFTDDAAESGVWDWGSYGFHSGQYTANHNVIWDGGTNGTYWTSYWEGIRRANIAIESIPESLVVSDEEKEEWVMEARLLRAYYHFLLVEFYGPLPFVEEVFEPDSDWSKLTRPSFNEVAQKIASECDAVINSEALPIVRENNKERFSAAFAYALKARVLLYNASPLNNPTNDKTKWEQAATASLDLLNLTELALVDFDDYDKLFKSIFAESVDEIIYRGYSNNAHSSSVHCPPMSDFGGRTGHKAGSSPTQELIDCFETKGGYIPVLGYNDADHTDPIFNPDALADGYTEEAGSTSPYDNRDARLGKVALYNGFNWGKPTGMDVDVIIKTYLGANQGFVSDFTVSQKKTVTGYYSAKFQNVKFWGPTQGVTYSYKVIFRLAEFYLNYAEAKNEADGPDNSVYLAVNAIRLRAGQPELPTGLSQDEMRKRIRNERRVELAYEDHRFFDQRRWKILDETSKVISGMKITRIGSTSYRYERVKVFEKKASFEDRYLQLPIPHNEKIKLPNISQSPGW